MKFNVEIDIDWIDEDNGLDDEIKDQLVSGLARKIENQFTDDIARTISSTAHNFVKAKTEMIINSVLEKPIIITEGWNNKTEYNSIYDMIEQKMTGLYEGKINSKGTCKEDPLLSNLKSHIESSVSKLLGDVQRIIEKKSNEVARDAVKNHDLIKALENVVTIK